MNIWKQISELLSEQQNVVYLKVVQHKGSSPGKQGFEMLVSENGLLSGTIGGGRTEFQLVEDAKKMLANGETEGVLRKQVHRDKDADSSGMICSGEQWVVLIPLNFNHIELAKRFATADGGALTLSQNHIEYSELSVSEQFSFNFCTHDDWIYVENINQKSYLYLIGGGHVGLAAAKICQDLDFVVTMFDDRAGLNTFEQNTYSDYKQIVDYQNIRSHIREGAHTYIVILTHNFRSDSDVLSALRDVRVHYLGVLGSSAKIKKMFADLETDGVSKSFLDSIDAPVGLSINSKTPAEIAISIAGKLISARNSNL